MKQFYPYQIDGGRFLASRKAALLADAPRVGKTGSIIHGADLIGAQSVLWLTRGAGRVEHARAWREFQRQARSVRPVLASADLDDSDVIVTSYSLASGALKKKLEERTFDLVALDECHLLKNRDARRTGAVLGNDDTPGFIRKARAAWAASGTPAPNHYGEMYPLIRALFPEMLLKDDMRFMSYGAFTSKFCRWEHGHFGSRIVGSRGHAELRALLEPHYLRRTMAEVMADVPPIRTDVLLLSSREAVSAVLAAETDKVFADILSRLKGVREEDHAALLAEAANKVDKAVLRHTAMAKVLPLAEWITEQSLPKLVVFGWFVEPLNELVKALTGLCMKPVHVDGSTPANRRAQLVEKFQSGDANVFVGQIEAAGEAINLSAADTVVFLDSAWVPGKNEQAMLRVVNTEKKVPTEALFATVEGSQDEHVQRTWARKASEISKVFH